MQLVAGPELDARVAEACGWTGDIVPIVKDWKTKEIVPMFSRKIGNGPPSLCQTWSPSRDLNAAFEAAENVGLFDENYRALRRYRDDDTWEVVEIYSQSEKIIGCESTPALAICAAILALHPSKEEK